MRNSLKRLIATSLIAVLAVTAIGTSPKSSTAAQVTAVSQVSAVAATHVTETTTVGSGWAQKLACMACVGGILAVTGTGSIAALAIVVGANPELASACVIGCIAAFA